jgi:hypothetical protein
MHLPASWFPKLGFEVESPTHSLLGFVKAMHGNANADMALDVVAGRFSDKAKVKRSAGVLIRNGYITSSEDGEWAITIDGNNALIAATSRSGLPKRDVHRKKRGI